MQRLAEIIGPAPSEMSIDQLIKKLSAERDRVRESLDFFDKYGPINPKSKSKSKAKTKKAPSEKVRKVRKAKPPTLVEQLRAKGLSDQQIMQLIAKLEEEKNAS